MSSIGDRNARELEPLRALADTRKKKRLGEQGVALLDPTQAFAELEAGSEMSTEHRGRPLWLLKVPPEVARGWQNARASNKDASVASLRMVAGGSASSSSSSSSGKTHCVLELDTAAADAAATYAVLRDASDSMERKPAHGIRDGSCLKDFYLSEEQLEAWRTVQQQCPSADAPDNEHDAFYTAQDQFFESLPASVQPGIGASETVAAVWKEVDAMLQKSESTATQYRLDFLPVPPALRAFSTTASHGQDAQLEGFVKRNCTLVPVRNKQYSDMSRARNEGARNRDRVTRVLREQDRVVLQAPSTVDLDVNLTAGAGSGSSNGARGKKRQRDDGGEGMKRERLDAEQLKNELFRLFAERPLWTKAQLNERLNQPGQFLSEVLATIAMYHRDGDHKGRYELMEQYR